LSDMGEAKLDQVLDAISTWQSTASAVISNDLADELRATAINIELAEG